MDEIIINNLANKINEKEKSSHKTSSWSETTNNIRYPTEKLVKDSLDAKSDSTHTHNSQISYGQVDDTSTSTVFTATVSGVTALTDGTTVMLKNGVVTSASGFTLNVNNLGAKPVYNNMAAASADTTIFNVNYTMLFVYDSTRISDGCWICYRGYNSDNNTIGYQIRTNSTSFTPLDKTYRYRIMLEVENNKLMPVNTSSSTSATASKTSTMNTREFKLGGNIYYYSYSSAINANAYFGTGYIWRQYNFALGYSFNNTNAALVMTAKEPVYMVAEQTSNGMAKLKTPFFTQTLPNTADGLLYILLGYATSEVNLELTLDHPIFEYKNNGIRLYRNTYTTDEVDTLLNGKSDNGHTHTGYANSTHTHTKNQITDFPTIPSKTSDLANDSGFLTSHNPIDSSLSTTSTNAVQNKVINTALTGKSDTGHTHTKSEITDFPSSITPTSHTHGNLQNNGQVGSTAQASKNVVTDANGKITTEDKPTIPSASSTTPSADTTNGSVGTGTTWARSNHTHPKSSIYAESTHSHTKSEISDFPSLHTVATSGSYNDLTNKPNIPSGVVVDTELSSSSDNAIANSTVTTALGGKSDTGHTHNQYLTSHQDISGKLDIAQTSHKGKNIVVDSTTGNITFEDKNNHTHSQYVSYIPPIPTDVSELTDNSNTQFTPKSHTHGNLQNDGKIKINGTAQASKNVVTDSNGNITTEAKPSIPSKTSDLTNDTGFLTSHQDISGKLDIAQTSYKGKNVVVDSTTGNITFENKPSIPNASSTIPSADTENGSYGTGTDYARANHTHPKSTLYAEADHNHNSSYIAKASTDTGFVKSDGSIDGSTYLTTANASSTYVQKETGKGLFSGSYSDLTNKPSYTATVTNSTTGSYEIGKININGSNVSIYGKDTNTEYTHPTYSNVTKSTSALYKIKTNSLGHIIEITEATSTDIASLGVEITDTVYTHPSYTSKSSGLYKITVDSTGHISGTASVSASDLPSHTHSQYLTSHQDISGKIDTAGTGLSKSGTTLNHSNSITALTTSSLKKITYDAQGHITDTDDVAASDLPDHTHGDITANGTLNSSTVTYNYPNDKIVIKASAYDGALKPVTQIPSGVLWDSNAHNNIGSSANDTQATINTKIDTALGNKQATLVSGTTIKTINNESVLGSGNISIELSIDDIYPIGSIYMSVNSINPSILFGGTWVQIEDRFLLSAGSTYSAGSTGGSADAVVVEHTHTQNQHRHELTGSKSAGMSSGDYLRAGYGSTTDSKYTDYSTPSINPFGVDGTGKNMPPYLVVYVWKRVPTTYIINDDATTDNSSTLFGYGLSLRNNGINSNGYHRDGYYTIGNSINQAESMRVLSALTGETGNFVIEYDSYVEGSSGSSGFVIYNSATSWEKLTDDADSNKKYWYGYNDGSFHETAFYGNIVTNQKWVHYKYTVAGSTFSMEVTYDNSNVVTHSETIHLIRDSSTQYGLNSEWASGTKTRYKNIQAYTI